MASAVAIVDLYTNILGFICSTRRLLHRPMSAIANHAPLGLESAVDSTHLELFAGHAYLPADISVPGLPHDLALPAQ